MQLRFCESSSSRACVYRSSDCRLATSSTLSCSCRASRASALRTSRWLDALLASDSWNLRVGSRKKSDFVPATELQYRPCKEAKRLHGFPGVWRAAKRQQYSCAVVSELLRRGLPLRQWTPFKKLWNCLERRSCSRCCRRGAKLERRRSGSTRCSRMRTCAQNRSWVAHLRHSREAS